MKKAGLILIGTLVTLVAMPTALGSAVIKKHLNTNFNFEDQIVQGKYQYPDEAVTTVEDEKWLRDLLEIRKDFKDRLKQEADRR